MTSVSYYMSRTALWESPSCGSYLRGPQVPFWDISRRAFRYADRSRRILAESMARLYPARCCHLCRVKSGNLTGALPAAKTNAS